MKNKYNIAFFLSLLVIWVMNSYAWAYYPVDFDPVNFQLALEDYDLSKDRPHAPGYPLYVGLAKLASLFTGKQYAYHFVNLLFMSLMGWFLFDSLKRLKLPNVGLASALICLTHPLVWATVITQRSYISDAVLGTALLWWGVTYREKEAYSYGLGIGVFLALQAAIRPVTSVMLFPLALAVSFFLPKNDKVKKTLVAGVFGLVGIAFSYLMTVYINGGFESFAENSDRVMGSAFQASSIFGGGTLSAHLAMLKKFGQWLIVLPLPLVPFLGIWIWKRGWICWKEVPLSAYAVGAAWFFPPMAFYMLIYYIKPTYHLIYLPCIFIALAWLIHEGVCQNAKKWAWGLTILILLGQLAFFWIPAPWLPPPLYKITHDWFVGQDKAWDEMIQEIGESVESDTLVVYKSHPKLPFPVLRLILNGQVFGVYDSDKQEVILFKDWWVNPENNDEELKGITKVTVIDTQEQNPTYKSYQVSQPHPESLLKLL